jgi:hypothetical protein
MIDQQGFGTQALPRGSRPSTRRGRTSTLTRRTTAVTATTTTTTTTIPNPALPLRHRQPGPCRCCTRPCQECVHRFALVLQDSTGGDDTTTRWGDTTRTVGSTARPSSSCLRLIYLCPCHRKMGRVRCTSEFGVSFVSCAGGGGRQMAHVMVGAQCGPRRAGPPSRAGDFPDKLAGVPRHAPARQQQAGWARPLPRSNA